MQPVERPIPAEAAGLTASEVDERIRKGLVNVQPRGTEKSVWRIIRDNTLTPFNLFNVCIAGFIVLVGAYRNLLFMTIIAANTAIGIFQEIRTRRLLAKLILLSAPKAHVVRDGAVLETAIESIVLDDILLLETGRQVPVDALVVQGEIEANEALLTGESDPIIKSPGDRLLSGSFVTSGRCFARAEHLGSDNYATSIEQQAKTHRKFASKLMGTLNRIIKFTSAFIVPLGAVMMLKALFLLNLPMDHAVTTTAAALLGMMPNGLVLLTTMSLMVAVYKLAKTKTLVHELFSIEALSRVDMLCLDKTGTLTEGNMRVLEWIPLNGRSRAETEDTIGAFLAAQTDVNATIEALRLYFPPKPVEPGYAIIPFSSQKKWSAVSFSNESVIMGAPDVLWQKAKGLMPSQIAAYERDGARVILFAQCREPVNRDLPGSLTPLAAIALSDPIRSDAGEILAFFRKEGVTLKIISGDHPNTLSAIARKAGMQDADNLVDMSRIQDDREIRDAALRYSVFGRVSPQQKKILISALRAAGHTVAMMGDGVNDVLALRESDCSITLGSGTDAARNISQIVMTGNNFASLPGIVLEGRRVVNNIKRTASLYLVKTVYSSAIALIAVFFAIRYPYIPIQMTLIGTLMEGIPSFFLALEPNDRRIDGRFFEDVLQQTIPYGLVIASLMALINAVSGFSGPDSLMVGSLCVYTTGAFCAALLYRACRPFNNLRLLLWTSMTVLMILAFGLFPEFFVLAPFTWLSAAKTGIFVMAGAGLLFAYSALAKRLLGRYYKTPGIRREENK